MTRDFPIYVVGCGAIGLPIAVAFAARGATVVGVDTDPRRVAKLSASESGLLDAGLAEALRRGRADGSLQFRKDLGDHPAPRIFILAVPTPADENKKFARQSIDDAFTQIVACAHDGDLLVIKSTVPVGTARRFAGLAQTAGRDLHIAVCPDRSIAGEGFSDQFSFPHIIGGVTPRAADLAAVQFKRLGAVHIVESAEAAELLKLLSNVQRDVTFALANQFALICEALNVDFENLVDVARDRYPRFQIANSGPVGGPCLSKDTYLLAESVAWRGDLIKLPLAAREVNISVLNHLTAVIGEAVKAIAQERAAIAILGIAFKGRPPTKEQRGSAGRHLVTELQEQFPDAVLRAWDPEADNDELTAFDAVENADVVVLTNNHVAIADLAPEQLASRMRRGGTIFALCGGLKKPAGALPNDVRLHTFGKANQ